MKTKSLEQALEKLYDKLGNWLITLVEMIPNFVIAILVFLVFYLISKLVANYGSRLLNKVSKNHLLNKLIARFLGIIIITTGLFFALGLMHLDKTVTSLLAGIGIAGLAISFAFQHTAANILSGIIISIRSSVNVGDLIQSNDQFGNVQRVGLRAINIINVTGQHVEIPNRLFLDNPFIEFSQTGFRRIDIIGKVNFRENLAEIKSKSEELMASFDFIYEAKQPNLVYNELSKEKVDFTLRVWMNFTNNDGKFLNARSQCLVALSELFNDLDIEIARDEIVYLSNQKKILE